MFNNNSKLKRSQSVKLSKSTDFKLDSRDIVKVIRQGKRFAEVSHSVKKPKQAIKKLSKDSYEVLSTGEVKQFAKTDVKQTDSLRKTFSTLSGLIRHNFTAEGENQLFLTLTYAENMTDDERLYRDFKVFYKRLKRKYSDHKFDYIAVAEPQKRGAWHLHVLLKSDQPTLFIDNRLTEKLWGQGFTDTERLCSDDVGTYYVAYFTDVINESNVPREEYSKARQKGARLHFYPKGFKFYRTSRGIEKPPVEEVVYGEVVREYGEPVYKQSFDLLELNAEGESERVINTFSKASFKRSD